MGERSITEIRFADGSVNRFYLHHGSPEYQVPNMAEFVWWAWRTGTPIAPDHYARYLTQIPERSLPHEPLGTDAPLPGDLEHLYLLDASQPVLRYHYWRRVWSDWTPSRVTQWEPRLVAVGRLKLYEAAVGHLTSFRRSVARLRNRDQRGPEDPHPTPTLTEVDAAITEAQQRVDLERLPGASQAVSWEAFHAAHDCDAYECDAYECDAYECDAYECDAYDCEDPETSGHTSDP